LWQRFDLFRNYERDKDMAKRKPKVGEKLFRWYNHDPVGEKVEKIIREVIKNN
jgi:hypothetical protein